MNYLSKNILSQPQLCSASFFQTICEVVDDRETRKLLASNNTTSLKSNNLFVEKLKAKGVGVLEVNGVLTAKPTQFSALCGGCDYQSLIAQMESMASEGFKQVVMVVSSGGGEAYNCFYTSKQLRKIADDNGIKLTAYLDNTAASAAYALSSAAHEIVSDEESADIGSIGVVIRLMNDSKALEKAGYSRTFIYSGSNKIPFNDDGEFKDEFLADLQKGVDATYQRFVEHVSSLRPMTKQQVIDTQAKTFNAKTALELGLVDKLSTQYAFLESLGANSVIKPVTTTTKAAASNKALSYKLNAEQQAKMKSELMSELNIKPAEPSLSEAEQHKLKLQEAVRIAKLKREGLSE